MYTVCIYCVCGSVCLCVCVCTHSVICFYLHEIEGNNEDAEEEEMRENRKEGKKER